MLWDLCWSDTMWILVEMGLMGMSKRFSDLWAWTGHPRPRGVDEDGCGLGCVGGLRGG